ncbi:hypothetical protein AK830_g1858 [Neonectria ditissima]|uniref:RRM domain-containing protein n=1 Tax=Neonectria ditissima TaxID=78410 RepID=A0A0P7BLS9_9HYPO|nr:hypothetical protein AK830_g1858 [Neonectria ditissima]
MADKMDRGLDEIIADTRTNNGPRNQRGRGGGGGNRRREREPRQEYPRDGVKKSIPPSCSPSETNPETWIVNGSMTDTRRTVILFAASFNSFESHLFSDSRRGPAPRRRRESPEHDSKGAKVRVENIHYDLTEDDLDELFKRIGPVVRLQLRYDRAGRSEGTAYVTYELKEDAEEAVKQFDGANANGQPIRLSLLPSGPARNPFDTAVMPGRPLAERISSPRDRARSLSPHRHINDEDASLKGIDRYVPGQGSRSRSPMPRRARGGRRPGARRDDRDSRDNRGSRDNRDGPRDHEGGGRGGRGNPRSKKTQEELDAEMEDYFGGSAPAPVAAASTAAPTQATTHVDDIDMIE